ncbi:hypothetical protein [Photobacterium leiognathi]|uniref:hypothetical protein n=1 Tax=Photobacterium leiognathi TaxID=553611 RepID=UPI002981618D|nr:hypothetical protein [Photobacterium leiognathi]
MIDISIRMCGDKKKYHFNGFIENLKYQLYTINEKYRLSPKYNFEKKFYRSLVLDKDFAKSIIFASSDELINIENQNFYRKHRLYFLLCLKSDIRKSYPFNIHLNNELKSMPRDLKRELMRLSIGEVSKEIRERCNKAFNYEKFIKVKKGKENSIHLWNAYNYIDGFSPKVCPYCNMELTTLVTDCLNAGNTKYVLRPALDHFLPKSIFPFYALSVNNLIPSCHTCNSSLKKDIDFKRYLHINPMGDSFKNKAFFYLALRRNDLIYDVIDDIYNKNNFDMNKLVIKIKSECNKTKRNIKTFELLKRYNTHKDEYTGFISNLKKISGDNIEILMQLFDSDNKHDAVNSFLQFNPDVTKHCDISFSVLKNDLIEKYVKV